MDTVIQFVQSDGGRVARVILGILLLALGLLVLQGGVWGIVVTLIGFVPLVTGLLGVCLFAPLFGYTLTGHKPLGPASSTH